MNRAVIRHTGILILMEHVIRDGLPLFLSYIVVLGDVFLSWTKIIFFCLLHIRRISRLLIVILFCVSGLIVHFNIIWSAIYLSLITEFFKFFKFFFFLILGCKNGVRNFILYFMVFPITLISLKKLFFNNLKKNFLNYVSIELNLNLLKLSFCYLHLC